MDVCKRGTSIFGGRNHTNADLDSIRVACSPEAVRTYERGPHRTLSQYAHGVDVQEAAEYRSGQANRCLNS